MPDEAVTLYDRLGGDSFNVQLAGSFFDEVLEDRDLRPFFKNISVSALKIHQVKLFRIMYGKDEDKPEEEDMLEYMLKTHTRLFRETGLDETHFDIFMECFKRNVAIFKLDQSLVDECLAAMEPFRIVFEYGATVAKKEKTMTASQLKSLPKASGKMIGTKIPVVLPEYSQITTPEWLVDELSGKGTQESDVRAWTCELTDHFGIEDEEIADTFLDQPYMDHHVYCCALLQLAFMPGSIGSSERKRILNIVRYPRGRDHSPLSKRLFDRMTEHVYSTCLDMGMWQCEVERAQKQLQTYRSKFADKTRRVGGIDAPHILRKKTEVVLENKPEHVMKNPLSRLEDLDNSDDSSTSPSVSSNSKSSSGFSINSKKQEGPTWWNFFRSGKTKNDVKKTHPLK